MPTMQQENTGGQHDMRPGQVRNNEVPSGNGTGLLGDVRNIEAAAISSRMKKNLLLVHENIERWKYGLPVYRKKLSLAKQ